MRPGGLIETALAALLQLSGLGLAAYAAPAGGRAPISAPAESVAPHFTGTQEDPRTFARHLDVTRAPEPPPRVLRLERLGTRERIELSPLASDGTPRAREMEELTRFFAPVGRAKGEEQPVVPDARLVELLIRISEELGGAPLILVSGHRRPGKGTSRKSYHVKGMAADIAVHGKKPVEVRKAAIEAGALGVGLYPGFVHVDARTEPYRWSGGGRRR